MTCIHEQPDWPAFRWNDASLVPVLTAVRHKQGRLLGRMESLGFEFGQEASLVTLTSDVVKSSAIEGEVLDPSQVRSSIVSRLGLDAGGQPPVGRDVEGIVEVMVDATRQFEKPLSAERLSAWHAVLFPTGRSGMLKITVGAWRLDEQGPMRVVSGHTRGRVHFQAPEAPRISQEMKRFLAWFEDPSALDAVLRAGIAHLWFVTIHPFDDGNGRIARAIADMALARSDGSPQRFYSMSSQIEKEKKDYYRQLESQQRGNLDITPWLTWFLGCLGRTIDAADESLGAVLFKAAFWEKVNHKPVNDRQRTVINRLLGPFEGFLTTSKYAALAKCSTDTALRDIRELLGRGILLRNERGGRSTNYRLGAPDSIQP